MTRAFADLLDTDPITLTEASEIVLRGVVGVGALRAEIKRGNLVAYKVGKNLFTTPIAIREMMERCREKPALRGYTSVQTIELGSSETADGITELDLLNRSVERLKPPSLNTSQINVWHRHLKAAKATPSR